MSSTDVWSDFETIRHDVKGNTVDRLKQILNGFNEECGTNFTKSGKKQDIIDRITRELDSWRRTNTTDKWSRAKAVLNQVRAYGAYSPTRAASDLYSSPAAGSSHYTATANSFHQSPATGVIARFDPYAPPRKPTMPVNAAAPSVPSTSTTPSIRFKPSPFFRVERAVSNVIECPESNSQMDRRQQTLSFIMNADLIQKLSSQSPKYQLRLYCTSSSYYTPTPAFRTNLLCPIEFPPTCEVRVNTVQLQANLKGMKKKPGTAPPPDLGKSIRLTNGAANRVEMIYVNSQQPVQPKKYYLVVMLVEVTTVDQLIDRLKKGKHKSSSEILARMNQASSDEDDIVAGHQKMSLKCPLSYMRITTPCRSWQCVHPQCFDAFSWFSVMEQTTTWMCPVCEKTLNVDDLIVDGYFDDILQSTSEELEDVIVEPDGQWHSADNICGSAAWKAAHPAALPNAPTIKQRSPTPVKPTAAELERKKPIPSNAEIVILDSDDEDEGRVKRELSPSYDSNGTQRTGFSTANGSHASLAPPRSQTVESDVIDLTLDSDDEAPQPPQGRKRRSDEREALSPTEQIWKKSRMDSVTSSAPSSTSSPIMDSSSYALPRPPRPTVPAPPSPAAHRYDNAFSSNPPYHPLPSRPPVPAPVSNGPYVTPAYAAARAGGSGSSSVINGSWRR